MFLDGKAQPETQSDEVHLLIAPLDWIRVLVCSEVTTDCQGWVGASVDAPPLTNSPVRVGFSGRSTEVYSFAVGYKYFCCYGGRYILSSPRFTLHSSLVNVFFRLRGGFSFRAFPDIVSSPGPQWLRRRPRRPSRQGMILTWRMGRSRCLTAPGRIANPVRRQLTQV